MFTTGQQSELQALLETLAPNVYFQPPSTLKMMYPCIHYQRDNALTEFADNAPYSYNQRYQLTIIDPDPNTDIRLKVAALPTCAYNRFFVADNLNHDVFTLYF